MTLVRARHLQYDPPGDTEPRPYWPYDPESDLARIVRTHTFIKVVADTAKAKGKTNPLTAASFLSAVLKQMTVDSGLKNQLLKLVLHYRNINVATLPETTLSVTDVNDYYYGGYGMGDVLFPVQPADDNVIKAWDSVALPKPVVPKSVSVVSITGSYDAAVAAGQALATHGLKISGETTGTVPSDVSETLVLYHPQEIAAKAVPTTTTTGATTTTAATTTTTVATTTTGTSTTTTTPVGTTTTVPTPNGQPVSSSSDQQEPWDPRAC